MLLWHCYNAIIMAKATWLTPFFFHHFCDQTLLKFLGRVKRNASISTSVSMPVHMHANVHVCRVHFEYTCLYTCLHAGNACIGECFDDCFDTWLLHASQVGAYVFLWSGLFGWTLWFTTAIAFRVRQQFDHQGWTHPIYVNIKKLTNKWQTPGDVAAWSMARMVGSSWSFTVSEFPNRHLKWCQKYARAMSFTVAPRPESNCFT